MGVLVRGLLLLVPLLLSNGKRTTYTHKPLLGKACWYIKLDVDEVQVREHHQCQEYCINNAACIGGNYDTRAKMGYLFSFCVSIDDSPYYILIAYGAQTGIRGFLENQ